MARKLLILASREPIPDRLLEGGTLKRLLSADGTPTFLPPNKLLYVRQGTLFVQDFDLDRFELTGDPAEVANDVMTRGKPVSASTGGAILYRNIAGVNTSQFVWMDREGNRLESFNVTNGTNAANPQLSPDDDRVVFEQTSLTNGAVTLWTLDLTRGGVSQQMTVSPTTDAQPVWSPDGATVAFFRVVEETTDLHVMDVDSSETSQIEESEANDFPTDWSSDGEWLIFTRQGPEGQSIWARPMNGSEPAEPVQIVNTPNGDDRFARISPDGRWIAYESEREGRLEIYLRAFSGQGREQVVSRGSGTQVVWSPQGDELFYFSLEGQFMSVPLSFFPDEVLPDPGDPVALFPAPTGTVQFRGQQYDVSEDGQQFLMTTLRESTTHLTLITDVAAMVEDQ